MSNLGPLAANLFNSFRSRRAAWTWVAVLALLAIFSAEILLASHQQTQVYDEADHLFSGYEYWTQADFGRNPEHPPLAKLIAGAALLQLSPSEPNIPYANFKSSDYYNGAAFLYKSDAGAETLLHRGRDMLLFFALALALAVFAAASEMFSPAAGLIALALFCFEPVIIANAGLILTDTTVSCTMFLAVYTFYRYRKQPTIPRLLLCAVAVGLSLAAKHSGVFIFPILAVIAAADIFFAQSAAPAPAPARPAKRQPQATRTPLRRNLLSLAIAFAVIASVSYAMLWAFYGFRYSAHPNGVAMVPSLDEYASAIPSSLERSAIDFCARHQLLPEAYLFGWADILQIPGTRVAFVLGQLHKGTWLPGFPLVILMKTTLALLVLVLLFPFARLWRRREFLFLAIPAAFYLLLAIGSRMSAEARYVLPMYPFLIVLAGAASWTFAKKSRPWAVAIGTLLLFAAASSLHAYPYYLAYTNELFGGPANSYRILAGSNGDGGQALKSVKAYLDRNPSSACWFDYVNPFVDPHYYGIPCNLLPPEIDLQGGPPPQIIPPTISGTVLISATEIAGRSWEPDDLNPYAPFIHLHPDAVPGDTVVAYRGTFQVPLLAAYSHSLNSKWLMKHGRVTEALAEAQQAARLAPASATMQAGLGITLLQAGQTEAGRQTDATALRLALNDHPELQQSLIHVLQQPGISAPPVAPPPTH